MLDACGVDDSGRVLEAVAVQARRCLVQCLVVEGLGQGSLVEVASDDRHGMDGRHRRDAQVAQRRDEPAPGRVGQRKVVDRGREDVRDLLGDQLLGCRHPDENRLWEAADRGARLLAERGVRLVADDELVRVSAQVADVAREPRVGLDRDGVVARRLLAALDRRDDPVAVALLAELAVELGDEQAAVREDEDADGARGLDEARGGDRLARRGRMAKAEAPNGARIGLLGDAVLGLGLDVELCLDRLAVLLHLDLGELLGRDGAVAVQGLQEAFLVGGDQLGEHSRQRVDLVAAKLRSGGEPRRTLAEHALEPEHEPEPRSPLRGRAALALLDLFQRRVERDAPRGLRRENPCGIFAFAQERLARPRFRSERGLGQAVRGLRRSGRMIAGPLHVCNASPALHREGDSYATPSRWATLD